LMAVVLAGGQGRRLRPLTDVVPKPLVEVGGRPIIEWQIGWLRRYGVDEFLVCAGYLKEKIICRLGNGSRLGVRIGYVVEDEPLGTGGALRNAEPFLRGEPGFYVVNGDILTDLDPRPLARLGGYLASLALVPLRSPYGIVETEGDRVTAFREKPLLEHWVNAGVYYMTPQALKYMPEKGDLERTAFPQLAKEQKLKAVKYKAKWKSIDTHKDLQEAEKIVKLLA